MERPTTISPFHPFPDRCGWNQAIEYEREWYIFQLVKPSQSFMGGLYHFIATFLYHIPLVDTLLYTITYVALSIIDPKWIEHTYERGDEEEKAHLEKRGLIASIPFEPPVIPHDFVRVDIHDRMRPIFRRHERKNVLLVGPKWVGKTKIAQTFEGGVILDHFEHADYKDLSSFIKENNGRIIACTRRPIPYSELFERFFTVIEVEQPPDIVTKQIILARFPTVPSSITNTALELCHFYQSNICMPGAIVELFDAVKAKDSRVTLSGIQSTLTETLKAPVLLPEERQAYYLTAREVLKRRVFGQDHVIDEIAKVFENIGYGFRGTGTLGIFHFVGPTGVGKTALAEAIGEFFFQSKQRYLFVPMAQYQHSHMISALLGAPPGLVGFEQGGLITEKAKEGPFVLLLDEIDKAHPDIITALLQHAEKGTIVSHNTQSFVSIEGCIIIMTSNLGSHQLLRAMNAWSPIDPSDPLAVKKVVEPAVQKHFSHKWDLLNRFETFYFLPLLTEETVHRVVISLLQKEARLLQERKAITFTWTEGFIDAYHNLEKMKESGARWIERSIHIRLRNQILRERFPPGTRIQVDWDGERREDIIRVLS